MNLDALKPGHGLPAPKWYKRLRDMPPDVLATRVVSSLIEAKGNLQKYAEVIEALIVNMRAEYTDVSPWIDPRERLPDCEGRYFIVYRYKDGRQEAAYIGDYNAFAPTPRWRGLPQDCEVIWWMDVPDWPGPVHRGGGSG